MKRKLICLLIAISLVTASALFAGGKKEDAGGKKIVKLAHTASPTSYYQMGAEIFKEELEKMSPNIEIQIFPSGQMGSTLELMQGLQTGAIGVFMEFAFIWEGVSPEFKPLATHYTFGSTENYMNFINSDLFEKWNEKLIKKAGVRITGTINGGCEFNFISKKKIESIEDLKGIKNRCAQMAPLLESWRAYGANPMPLAWGELYTSLATGVVDGFDNPLMDIYDEKFYEIAKYLIRIGNLQTAIEINTSEKVWQTLTSEEQEHWMQAIKIANEKVTEKVNVNTNKMLKNMEAAGVTILYPDKTPFIKAIESNIDNILNNDKDAINAYWEIRNAGY